MKHTGHYRIQKQILDIRHGKHHNAYALQNDMRTRYYDQVLPLLENICRECCPDDSLIQIDTLTVSLPPMTHAQYTDTWATAVADTFRQRLSQAIARANDPQTPNVSLLNQTEADLKLLTTFLHTGALPWSHSVTPQRPLAHILREYLKKEPETIRQLLSENLRYNTFAKRLCYQFPPDLIHQLFVLLQPDHAADIRNIHQSLHYCIQHTQIPNLPHDIALLLRYHSLQDFASDPYQGKEQHTAQLIHHISYEQHISYKTLLHHLLYPTTPETEKSQTAFIRPILETLYRNASTPSRASQLFQQIDNPKNGNISNVSPLKPTAQQQEDSNRFQQQLRQLRYEAERIKIPFETTTEALYNSFKDCLSVYVCLRENDAAEAVKAAKHLREAAIQLLQKSQPNSKTAERFNTALEHVLGKALPEKRNENTAPERHQDGTAQESLQSDSNSSAALFQHQQPRETYPLPEALYLQNAGMVVLWPFFTQLFKGLGLTEKQHFIDTEKRYRAIHLLQYLACGTTADNEYVLGLNKLLCGLPLGEPLPQHLPLLKEEKAAAEALIAAATSHWEVIRNTSVKGFREAFLMREGKLSRKNGQPLLQVEQKSYDMVMDKLPWAISVVKLPWMPEALFVEW